MAQAGKKSKGTPGRMKKSSTQYWDIGKVGRKTGITLEDKGVRDENGLEPMSHIFSSPVHEVNGAVESSEGLMQESSGPEVDTTIFSRKTPRLPPPRASTPKHTNIGSPKRMSTGRARAHAANGLQDSSPTILHTQPPANRILDFNADTVHKSIEKPSPSPFKPRHALRRSNVPRESLASPVPVSEPIVVEEDEDEDAAPQEQYVDDAPIMLDDDNYYDVMPAQDDVEDAQLGAVDESPSDARTTRGRPSDVSITGSGIQPSPAASASTSNKKRQRAEVEEDQADQDPSLSHSQISESGPAQKKQRGKSNKTVVIHHRNGEDETIDPALLAHGDAYEVDTSLEAALAQPSNKGKGKKGKALKEKDRNQAVRARGSPVKLNESPSKLRQSREKSAGPANLYHLRATTPFEDAGSRVSRFGRNLIQPLKYWANEARIYKRGEIEGIVRAEEVEKPKTKRPKRKKKRVTKLDDIEEEDSDAESVQPDEWEDEVGVIGGMVANWDADTQMGVPDDLIREDLAFASSSIVTREVANSDFRYAKIMTLPFFGSGIVELPPEATKRIKNSRKMQMCFFVHQGKVMVEIGAAGASEVTQFAISKGGVWVVPRGNNYAITNESKTTTAKVFFAQGNEVEALADAAAARQE